MADDERSKKGNSTARHFAPYDLTDGREPYDWPTRWPRRAQYHIAFEACVLFGLTLASPFLMIAIWNGRGADWFGLQGENAAVFGVYGLAWTSGLLGGTSFSLKWLYHSVAKGSWHRDRLLWRLATPFLSASLAFVVVALVRSELLPILNANSLEIPAAIVAFGYLSGYFSDHAVAALLRLAQRVFGDVREKEQGSAGTTE